MSKFGKLLKFICLFWCMAALGNAVLSAMAGRQARVMTHVLLLALGVTGFLLGHWLGEQSTARQMSTVKARWWQSNYGFRLAVFLSTSWMVGSFLWQDSYDRNLSIVLGPSAFLIAMYWAYKLFVAPRPKCEMSEEQHEAVMDPAPEAVEADVSVEELGTSAAGRERAMDDLIKRMSAK